MSHNGQSRLVSLPGFVSLPRDLRYVDARIEVFVLKLRIHPESKNILPESPNFLEHRVPKNFRQETEGAVDKAKVII